eukprot:TRINITY_DN19549_c0_g1_i1.p1 TRINITY_DN19549_c0_g1~~TRINITY_DN19549_c0_g1_i1.p1  ORF type:complete len:224 (-),score=63.81 TRINITY_DN19549_c0_g1_i1:352-1023(-)
MLRSLVGSEMCIRDRVSTQSTGHQVRAMMQDPSQQDQEHEPGYRSPMASYGAIDANMAKIDPRIFNVYGAANTGGQQDEFILGGQSDSRSFGDKINYSLGCAYLTGIGVMGSYGVMEGLTNPHVQGKSLKLRANSVMNASGLRGAKAGNGLGALTLFYCLGENLITTLRKRDGPENFVASGGLAGMLFKSTAGGRTALVAGGIGMVTAAGIELLKEYGPEMPI